MIKGLLLVATSPRMAGYGTRYRVTRLVACARDVAFALWVVGVLAFCATLIAGVMA